VGGGGLTQRDVNSCEDRVHFLKDFIVPETQHTVTTRIQKLGPGAVATNTIAPTVLTTINLDDKLFLVTGKVDEIPPDRRLPAEMRAVDRHLPQIPPELSLGVRRLSAQRTRARNSGIRLL
jgi:hypothetical protein